MLPRGAVPPPTPPPLLPSQIFQGLATLGPVMHPDDVAAGVDVFPFRTLDCPGEPHPGLRAYPFLGQV